MPPRGQRGQGQKIDTRGRVMGLIIFGTLLFFFLAVQSQYKYSDLLTAAEQEIGSQVYQVTTAFEKGMPFSLPDAQEEDPLSRGFGGQGSPHTVELQRVRDREALEAVSQLGAGRRAGFAARQRPVVRIPAKGSKSAAVDHADAIHKGGLGLEVEHKEGHGASNVGMSGRPRPYQIMPKGNPPSFSTLHFRASFVGTPFTKPATVDNNQYRLTKERVQQYADSAGRIMVTWANHHYLDFVLNWAEHVVHAGVDNYIVGALDDSLLKELVGRGIPCFAMSTGLIETDFGWGTKNFHKMGREKIRLIYMFASLGFTSIISDVDTVWLRNPFPFFDLYPEADILTSSDHLQPTHKNDTVLEDPHRAAHSAYNIGIMLMKPSTAELAKEWNELLDKDDKIWDQNAFNDLFRRGMRVPRQGTEKNLFYGYGGKLKLGVLPVSVFCSGHTYFVSNWAGHYGLVPFVVHATFQYSGTEGKRHRFRERLLWFDPPEYFRGKFLYYDPKVDLAALKEAVPPKFAGWPPKLNKNGTRPHMNIVHDQILQLRSAVMVAQLTKRILILPPLYCAMDRWWAPHDGNIPGSESPLPFICPADHVLEVSRWFQNMDENSRGPNLAGFREYSFLHNPRLPHDFFDSRVNIRACRAGDSGCKTRAVQGDLPYSKSQILAISPDNEETALTEILATQDNVRLMRLENPRDIITLYRDAKRKEGFFYRFIEYIAIWCCVWPERTHGPGHIWYDPFIDIPHRDRHNRPFMTPQADGLYWFPILGP